MCPCCKCRGMHCPETHPGHSHYHDNLLLKDTPAHLRWLEDLNKVIDPEC